MHVLKELFRHPGVPTIGKTLYREAVRGIIPCEQKLLLIHSAQRGDYKFPGGGVEGHETHAETLLREIREECGATLINIDRAFGCVIEYIRPSEADYDVFKMTSFYYVCHIDATLGQQQLDPYEHDLGFKPVWVECALAIQANRLALQTGLGGEDPEWAERETFVLEQVQGHLLKPGEL